MTEALSDFTRTTQQIVNAKEQRTTTTMPTGQNPIPTHVLNKRRHEAEAVMVVAERPAVARAGISVHPEHAMELAETEKNSIKSFPRY